MTTTISNAWLTIIALAAIWDLFWRGWALWRAARRNSTVWFVVILIVNSVGLIPIIYLLLTKGKEHEQKH